MTHTQESRLLSAVIRPLAYLLPLFCFFLLPFPITGMGQGFSGPLFTLLTRVAFFLGSWLFLIWTIRHWIKNKDREKKVGKLARIYALLPFLWLAGSLGVFLFAAQYLRDFESESIFFYGILTVGFSALAFAMRRNNRFVIAAFLESTFLVFAGCLPMQQLFQLTWQPYIFAVGLAGLPLSLMLLDAFLAEGLSDARKSPLDRLERWLQRDTALRALLRVSLVLPCLLIPMLAGLRQLPTQYFIPALALVLVHPTLQELREKSPNGEKLRTWQLRFCGVLMVLILFARFFPFA